NVRVSMSTTANDTVNIAAILDLNTAAGRAAKWSINLALQHLNQAINGTRLNLTIQESGGDVLNILDVFKSEVAAILVQEFKISKFMAPIAEAVDVPILSLSGVDGFVTGNGSTVPSHNYDDMEAIAAIVGYFQWKEVILLYQDEEFWLSGVNALSEALQERGKRVSQTAALPSISEGDQVQKALLQLNTSYIRVFIVYTSVEVAMNLFSIADGLGMMTQGYAWVVTDSIASSLDSSYLNTIQGIVGVKRLPTPQLAEMQKKLQLNSSDDGINRIGIKAYNSLMLVAKAVAILFSQDSQIEIINIVGGRSYRRVGIWEKGKGLLQSGGKQGNTLSPIIWPGDNAQAPNGYRKLVVTNIMSKSASNFSEFLERLSGYTRETFETAVNAVPYNLPSVYVTLTNSDSSFSGFDPFITELLDRKRAVKEALRADVNINWKHWSDAVESRMSTDYMKSMKWKDEMLVKWMSVLVYQGQFDLGFAVSVEEWLRSVDWSGMSEFWRTERKVWKVGTVVAGYIRSHSNLTNVVVARAGHEAPVDQRGSCQVMIESWVKNQATANTDHVFQAPSWNLTIA
ncbi:hypothetical protein KI387_031006, partial [Taxus chinensis]